MGRITRRCARWLADWLDRKSQFLEELAYGIGAWAREPTERNDDLSKIINTTLANRSRAVHENIVRNNALLTKLAKKNG